MTQPTARNYKRGTAISAERLNRIEDAIEALVKELNRFTAFSNDIDKLNEILAETMMKFMRK